MSRQIVQIQFRTSLDREQYEQLCESVIPHMMAIPGLCWKIWTYNERTGTGGGTYLFESAHAARAYLAGPMVEQLKAQPAFSDVQTSCNPVLEEISLATFAPLNSPAEMAASASSGAD